MFPAGKIASILIQLWCKIACLSVRVNKLMSFQSLSILFSKNSTENLNEVVVIELGMSTYHW